jgi:antitoxin component of MazEF toxin-antitoxin module
MALRRRVKRVGGSLGVLIPRDLAEVMGVQEGSPVRLSMVGRQMVVEPEDDTVPEASFRRAFAAVLRRYGRGFKKLADYDQGKARLPSETSRRRRTRSPPR